MFSHRQRHLLRRMIIPTIVLLALILPVFASMPDLVAQQDLSIQANPTETPVGPGGFQVNPTAVPTEDLPIRTNPTVEPTEELPIRENPTEVPVIDDIEANPVTGTVRVVKRDCPMGVDEDVHLTDYLMICSQHHDGVEFVVNDVNSAQAGVTTGGQVEWIGVDPGVFNITETIPNGYADPIVFCGYTESPGGGVQHPSRQDSTNGVVAGEFPNVLFEYVCYWMNIKQTTGVIGGPDVIVNPEGDGLSQVTLNKRSCPAGIDPNQDFQFYYNQCTAEMNGVSFTLTSDGGSSAKSTESGQAIWTGLPLGPFSIEEDIPLGYGDPVAFCSWTAFYQGVFYDAIFPQPVSVAGGVMSGEISIPNTGYVCFMYNIPSGPGSLADPGYPLSDLDLRKWECPDGTRRDQDRDVYIRECQLATTPFEFTLNNVDGSSAESTSGGYAHWSGLPLGPFTLEESIPDGYGSPMAFCGWYAEWNGYVYDAFPMPVPTTGGVIEAEITIPNTTWFCDVFNMKDGIDDLQANPTEKPTEEIDDLQANPTAAPTNEIDDIQGNGTSGSVRVIKRSCPVGVAEDAYLSEYLMLCPQVQDGVEFTLDEGDDSQSGVTSAGEVEWTGVDPGVFNIIETIPNGYADPIVFCGYTESPGGGVQHPSQQDATGGVVQGSFPDPWFEYVCYWMNIKQTTGGIGGPDVIANPEGDGLSQLSLSKRSCPAGIEPDQVFSYYQEMCTEAVDGITFTLTNDEGNSAKPIVSGQAMWTGLPLGPFSLDEDVPVSFGDPIVFCGWTAIWEGKVYDSFMHQLPAPGGAIADEITIPGTKYFCSFFNVNNGPGSLANPEDLTNTLVVRKWLCPAGIDHELELYELFRLCDLTSTPVEFTLDNADGTDTQATAGGRAQWDDVPLGPFTIQETVPAGYEDPFVWCGGTAFYMGAIYDDFHKLVPSTDGLVEGELVIPNTHHLCHFFNEKVEIDDFQVNPTEVPTIDDIQVNPSSS